MMAIYSFLQFDATVAVRREIGLERMVLLAHRLETLFDLDYLRISDARY